MTHRFDVVTVGIEHEGTIVGRMIVRPQPGRAVVFSARRNRRAIKGIDRRAILGRNRNMDAAIEAAFAADPEIRLVIDPETGGWCVASAFS
jgi:hypothetical protein